MSILDSSGKAIPQRFVKMDMNRILSNLLARAKRAQMRNDHGQAYELSAICTAFLTIAERHKMLAEALTADPELKGKVEAVNAQLLETADKIEGPEAPKDY